MEAEAIRQEKTRERSRSISVHAYSEATKDSLEYKEAKRLAMNTHIDGLKYWAKLGRKKILHDGDAKFELSKVRDGDAKFELSKVAGIILNIVDPEKNHPEWIAVKSRKTTLVFDENKNLIEIPEKHKIQTERILDCCKASSRRIGIEAYVDEETDKPESVGHSGRLRCNLPHACAVCADIEGGKAMKKVNRILRHADAQGFDAMFATLTGPHTRYTNDLKFVSQLLQGIQFLKNDEGFKALRKKYGIIDLRVGVTKSGAEIPYIRAFEVTLVGANGAHYHFHLLIIYDAHGLHEEAFADMKESLRAIWEKCAIKAGLVDSDDQVGLENFRENGFFACRADIHDKDSREKTASYITKLDSRKKLAKEWATEAKKNGGVYKLPKNVGYAPFETLTKIIVSDIPSLESAKTEKEIKDAKRELWNDMLAWTRYICATIGKRIVDYSNGLTSWDEAQAKEDGALEKKLKKIVVGALDNMQYNYLYSLGLVPYVKTLFMERGIEGGKKALNELLQSRGLGECHSAEELAKVREEEAERLFTARMEMKERRKWQREQEQKAKEKARAEAKARKHAEKEAERERKREERERKKARAPVEIFTYSLKTAGG